MLPSHSKSRYVVHCLQQSHDKKSVRYFLDILFDVTAGSRPSQLFFCKTPGCAAEVTAVFCNEELLLYKSSIENCTGPPPLGTVCQHNGLAFVAINTSGVCDFEGEFRHIQTEKCKGIYFLLPKALDVLFTVISHLAVSLFTSLPCEADQQWNDDVYVAI